MQAKELCSISVSPLVTAPFSVQWSADNHTSILTEKGVHVFELIPAPSSVYPTFNFSRSFIHPSEVLPAQSLNEEVDTVLWKLERVEFYLFLMEEAITPSINGARDMEPRVLSLGWSPWRLTSPYKCLLATVTSAGAVDILVKVSKNWFSICDLSAAWIANIHGESSGEVRAKLMTTPPTELRDHLRRLQATAICWSELYESGKECFAYLVVAYRNSEIVVWRIPELRHDYEKFKPSIAFQKIMRCNVRINLLKWIHWEKEVLIVLGYSDGQVDAVLLDAIDDKSRNCTVIKYWPDADRIPVSCIEVWNSAEHGMLVVICKGSYLSVLRPSHNGSITDTYDIHIRGYSITGVVEASDSVLLITTQDGCLFAVSFEDKNLVYIDIKNNLPSARVQYLGLSCSYNKSLFFNVTSPDIMHDHLINREPSTLCIFTMEGNPKWNARDVLMKNESRSIMRYWDCLESIRVQVLKSQDPPDMLFSATENLDKLSDYHLRIAMWTSMIAESYEKKKFPRRIAGTVEETSDAHPLIFLRLATRRLMELGSKKDLSTMQYRCASLLRSYIEVYLAGEEPDEQEGGVETVSIQNAKKALSFTDHLSRIELELCDICGEIITDISWKATSCPSGHKLPRCAITLLQVSTITYRSCPICAQILHPSLDEEYDEPLCPYCEVPAVYDSRVLNTKKKCGSPVRNLSKRRATTLQHQKIQESEKSNENCEENAD